MLTILHTPMFCRWSVLFGASLTPFPLRILTTWLLPPLSTKLLSSWYGAVLGAVHPLAMAPRNSDRSLRLARAGVKYVALPSPGRFGLPGLLFLVLLPTDLNLQETGVPFVGPRQVHEVAHTHTYTAARIHWRNHASPSPPPSSTSPCASHQQPVQQVPRTTPQDMLCGV